LPSVVEQDFTEKEIIIVDNGSHDSSVEWIKNTHKSVDVIELDKNFGFSKAVNEGIKRSKGEYILLLNNDVQLSQGFFSGLYLFIRHKKNAFSVQGKMLQYNERTKIDDVGDNLTLLGWTKKRGEGKPHNRYDKPVEVFSTCSGATIYRKSVFDEIGLFDEGFFAYLEDVDIGYRSRIFGYENWYCPDAVCFHVGSGTSGSRYNRFKVLLSVRNNVYLAYKNMPLIQLIVNVPFLTIGFFIKWVFFSFKGFGKDYLSGFVEGLKTLNKIEKIPFDKKNFVHYLKIEWALLKNTFTFFF